MENYPFLEADLGSDYENRRANIIGKVRAYHEDRAKYESICQDFPEHRLAFDKGEKIKQPTQRKPAQRTAKKAPEQQKGLFDGN